MLNTVKKMQEITGHSKKVSAELIICFLLVFIDVLLRNGAKTMAESAIFDIPDAYSIR